MWKRYKRILSTLLSFFVGGWLKNSLEVEHYLLNIISACLKTLVASNVRVVIVFVVDYFIIMFIFSQQLWILVHFKQFLMIPQYCQKFVILFYIFIKVS